MLNDPEAPGLEPGVSGAEVAAGGGSVLDKIKRRRDERDLTHEVFDIPSWDGDLKAKYQLLDREDIEKMVKRIRARQTGQGKQSGSDADLDFLIKSCVAIIAHDPEEEIEDTVIASGYDMVLTTILDPKDNDGNPIEISNQRELVAYMLGFNNVALATHSAKVGRWMQDTSKSGGDPQ